MSLTFLEGSYCAEFCSRIVDLENWISDEGEYLGASLSTDLSTLYGETDPILGADLNTTNTRVNTLATRVNGIQTAFETHGITAEAA